MYKIGSKPDLVMKSEGQAGEYKVVDDYSGVSNEKPNLVFAKSESLADEEGKKKCFQNYIFLKISYQKCHDVPNMSVIK